MTGRLPFFVYGTLLPGEHRHDPFLGGRTTDERAAVLPGALLYEGPGYPYAVEAEGETEADGEAEGMVHGALVTAAPQAYAELLTLLDRLEGYLGPGHPDNLYDRVARNVRPAGPGREPVLAWVYVAPAPVARALRAGGAPLPEGNWLTRQPRPVPRTP